MSERPASYYRPEDIERMEFVLSLIPEDTRTVLDVGAYDGKFASFARAQYSCTAHDVLSIDTKPKGEGVIPATVCSLPFKDRSVDCVVAMEILEHLTDRELDTAVYEIMRVAKSTVIVSVPDNEMPLGENHLQRFSEWRLTIALGGVGLKFYRVGKRQKYRGVRYVLGRIDMKLLGAYNRVFGVKRGEGAIWLIAKFQR